MTDERLMGSAVPYSASNGIAITNEAERENSTRSEFQKKLGKFCSTKTLKKRLPILAWLPSYNLECLAGDSIAGLTVALLLIPQAIAYGIVAGLTPNYGLYSAFIGSFVYCVLGSTKELSIGPTAIMALMTLHYSSQGGADYAVFLCFIAGVFELVAGLVNLGFLINFISEPVISGFTSAAAITIASTQIKGLFGLKLKTAGFFDTCYQVCVHIAESKWQDFVLGFSCMIVLIFLKEIRTIKWPCLTNSKPVFNKIIFFLSVGRNALIILIVSLIAFGLDGENQPFTLTGNVTPGLPPAQFPPFSTTINNVTMSFMDMFKDIGVGVVMVPFIAILDNIAVVGSYAKGKPFDANQEIIALGVINIVGSFFSSIPTTASLSRTALNNTSGVRTPAGGLLTGLIVLLALAFITPFFRLIPKAALSAVIICAVFSMVDYEIILPMWRSRKQDIIPLTVTFVACLVIGLEWGILMGIGVNLIMMLYDIATPSISVNVGSFPGNGCPYVLITPGNGVHYPNSSHVRSAIIKAGLREAEGRLPVIVDCTYIHSMDFTSAQRLKETVAEFERRNQTLFFLNVSACILQTLKALREVNTCNSIADAEEQLKDLNHLNEKDSTTISLVAQCMIEDK